MPTPASGAISLGDMRTEITRGTGAISMSEIRTRYGGSGAISFSDLYDSEGFTITTGSYRSKFINQDGYNSLVAYIGSVSPVVILASNLQLLHGLHHFTLNLQLRTDFFK